MIYKHYRVYNVNNVYRGYNVYTPISVMLTQNVRHYVAQVRHYVAQVRHYVARLTDTKTVNIKLPKVT